MRRETLFVGQDPGNILKQEVAMRRRIRLTQREFVVASTFVGMMAGLGPAAYRWFLEHVAQRSREEGRTD